RELAMLRWGLIPFWAEDPKVGYSTINARAETVATKPAFREAFRKRRCLIPADGFYEWQKRGERKQPYLIHMKNDSPFAFAGLWERWRRGEKEIQSCSIIVTEPNAVAEPIHDRTFTRRLCLVARPGSGRRQAAAIAPASLPAG